MTKSLYLRCAPGDIAERVLLTGDPARVERIISLMDEGATYGHFPAVYYYQGRVREQLGTSSVAESYREYLRIRGGSTEDPLVREVRTRLGN